MIIKIHFAFLNRSLLSCSTLFADTPYNKWVALITYLHAVRSTFLRCSLQNHKMTTGGTESLMMACKAYRDFGREIKGIDRPNMVIPRTAHSGFDKAAQYLGIHVNYVDVDVDTTKVNVAQMKRKINKNTIMVSVYRATIIAARISICARCLFCDKNRSIISYIPALPFIVKPISSFTARRIGSEFPVWHNGRYWRHRCAWRCVRCTRSR